MMSTGMWCRIWGSTKPPSLPTAVWSNCGAPFQEGLPRCGCCHAKSSNAAVRVHSSSRYLLSEAELGPMKGRRVPIRGIVPLVLCASAAARMPLAGKMAFTNQAMFSSCCIRKGRATVRGSSSSSSSVLYFSSSSAVAADEDLDAAVKAAVGALPSRPRVAVVGGGFAGLAAAYHLAAFGSDVTVFDPHEAGTGSGASSVAAGLLHPLTPRGKLIWKGEEGFEAAKHLIQTVNDKLVDDAAAAGDDAAHANGPRGCLTTDSVYRPLMDEKQVDLFTKAAEDLPQWVESLTREEIMEAVPGSTPECLGGVRIRGALAVDAPTYLRGLWSACRALVNAADADSNASGDGSGGDNGASSSPSRKEGATWVRQSVEDVHALAASGEFNAVVACVGAGVRALAGVKDIVSLRLVRGQTLLYDNVGAAGAAEQGGKGATEKGSGSSTSTSTSGSGGSDRLLQSAVLCGQYVVPTTVDETGAAAGGNGGKILLGSTQEPFMPGQKVDRPPDMAKALRQLRPKVARFFPALEGVTPIGCTAGVRVMQERSSYGRIPVAGRLPFSKRGWVIAALGARGLIHHAYLGKLVAACALLDSDDCLPPQVVAPLEDLGKDATGDL